MTSSPKTPSPYLALMDPADYGASSTRGADKIMGYTVRYDEGEPILLDRFDNDMSDRWHLNDRAETQRQLLEDTIDILSGEVREEGRALGHRAVVKHIFGCHGAYTAAIQSIDDRIKASLDPIIIAAMKDTSWPTTLAQYRRYVAGWHDQPGDTGEIRAGLQSRIAAAGPGRLKGLLQIVEYTDGSWGFGNPEIGEEGVLDALDKLAQRLRDQGFVDAVYTQMQKGAAINTQRIAHIIGYVAMTDNDRPKASRLKNRNLKDMVNLLSGQSAKVASTILALNFDRAAPKSPAKIIAPYLDIFAEGARGPYFAFLDQGDTLLDYLQSTEAPKRSRATRKSFSEIAKDAELWWSTQPGCFKPYGGEDDDRRVPDGPAAIP